MKDSRHFRVYLKRKPLKRNSMPTFSLYGNGEVDLTDEEVRQLVDLIKENDGETDVDALDLDFEYPDIYETLEDAYREEAYESRLTEMVIEGFENDYLGEPKDDLMKFCEDELGFVFNFNEEDYRDASTGKLNEELLAEDKADYFWNTWLKEYFNSLTEGQQYSFVVAHFNCDGINVDDYDYDVEIPEEIVEMAKEEMEE